MTVEERMNNLKERLSVLVAQNKISSTNRMMVEMFIGQTMKSFFNLKVQSRNEQQRNSLVVESLDYAEKLIKDAEKHL